MVLDDFCTEVQCEEFYTEEYAVLQEVEEEELLAQESRYLERSGRRGYYE